MGEFPDVSDRVVLRPRSATGQMLRRLVPYTLAAAALTVDGIAEESVGLFVAAGGMALLGVLPIVLMLRFGKPVEGAVVISADGVSWGVSGATLAWSQVEQVYVRRRARVWRLLGVYDWVGFVTSSAARFAVRAGTRPMQRRISTQHVNAEVDDILAAVSRYAPATVSRRY